MDKVQEERRPWLSLFPCLSETSLPFNQRTPFADLYETYAGLSGINYASLCPLFIKLIPFYCDVWSFRFANFAWYFPVDNETKLLPEFLFLDAIAKFRKPIVIFVMSVRLSSCNKLAPTRYTLKTFYFEHVSKICLEISRLNKIVQDTNTLLEDQCTFMKISRWILPRIGNVSDKRRREN